MNRASALRDIAALAAQLGDRLRTVELDARSAGASATEAGAERCRYHARQIELQARLDAACEDREPSA